MRVSELIEGLEEFDQNAEVRVAVQPSYPLEYNLSDAMAENEDGLVVYLATGSQGDYVSGDIVDSLTDSGWGW